MLDAMTSDNPKREFLSVMQKENAKFTHPQEDLRNIFCHIYYLFNKERGKALKHIDKFEITNIVREIPGDRRWAQLTQKLAPQTANPITKKSSFANANPITRIFR